MLRGTLPSLLTILTSVSLLTGCASSGNVKSTNDLLVPQLPSSVHNAGGLTKLPKEGTKKNSTNLVDALVESEVKKHYALNQCIHSYNNLSLIYGSKKSK